MSKQLEAAKLLQKAADALLSVSVEEDKGTCSPSPVSSSSCTTSTSTSASSALRSIFAPYSSRSYMTAAAGRGRASFFLDTQILFVGKFNTGGKVTTTWINPEDGKEDDVEVNMEHLLQALLGCKRLPVGMISGYINFDNTSTDMTTVNTCEPSILFSKTDKIQEYTDFEETMMYIIVGAYGFGRA